MDSYDLVQAFGGAQTSWPRTDNEHIHTPARVSEKSPQHRGGRTVPEAFSEEKRKEAHN